MKPGDKLWRVPNGRHHGVEKEVTVVSVGRKWVKLDNGERCDMQDGTVDGGQYSPPAVCWADRGTYEVMKVRAEAWWRFRELVDGFPNGAPPGVTADRIRELRVELFGVDAS